MTQLIGNTQLRYAREPSIAIMEALPAEVLHFINDLEDEIDRLQLVLKRVHLILAKDLNE